MEHSTEPIPEYSSPSGGNRNPYLVPISIIIAGALVAGAVLGTKTLKQPVAAETDKRDSINLEAFRPVVSSEHFLGNIKTAEVVLVEYSDLECPFCKEFHGEMQKIMGDTELEGKVAWVYRHFPIASRHPKALLEADATECAKDLGGNAAFWRYVDRLFEISPTNNGLDLKELPRIAKHIGLDTTQFSQCIAKNSHQDLITADLESGVAVGVDGTPWSLLMSKSGKVLPISGYRTYAQLKSDIKNMLE